MAQSGVNACPDELLAEAAETVRLDDERGLLRLDELLALFDDARLHFLRGSVLAGLKRYGEAQIAMGRAIDADPQFHLARFQCGFLKFTSGDAAGAGVIWAPLRDLGPDNALALFVRGMEFMARDEFPDAVALLRRGMAANTENAALNGNIVMILNSIDTLLAANPAPEEEVSATHLLLQQYDDKSTRR